MPLAPRLAQNFNGLQSDATTNGKRWTSQKKQAHCGYYGKDLSHHNFRILLTSPTAY
eukprot:m.2065 g.2065  ORF g.2065 m.2065 type:complete len:57 (-) comp2513_c0_seq1:384-554(-)